jgi:hypothetical protein
MMHREVRDPALKEQLETEGMDDPFDMAELDPMETNAIESSVWELEALQTHYHPNVATLAKIIAEQFTKRSYNLEDFLDHSYTAVSVQILGTLCTVSLTYHSSSIPSWTETSRRTQRSNSRYPSTSSPPRKG